MSDRWKIRFRLSKSITVRPILIASDVTPRKVSSRTNVVVGTGEVVVAATVVEVGAVVVAGGTVVEASVVGATVVGAAEVVAVATVVELGATVVAGTAVVGATVVVVDTAATSTGDADPPCPQAVTPTKTAVRTAKVARRSGRIGTRGHGARTGCLVQDVGPAVGWQAAADPGTYPTVSPHDHKVREAPQAVRLGHL